MVIRTLIAIGSGILCLATPALADSPEEQSGTVVYPNGGVLIKVALPQASQENQGVPVTSPDFALLRQQLLVMQTTQLQALATQIQILDVLRHQASHSP